MSFKDVPTQLAIYFWAQLDMYVKNPTPENKAACDQTLEIVRKFEKGEGDPQIIKQIDEELAQNMPGYQEIRARINKEGE